MYVEYLNKKKHKKLHNSKHKKQITRAKQNEPEMQQINLNDTKSRKDE